MINELLWVQSWFQTSQNVELFGSEIFRCPIVKGLFAKFTSGSRIRPISVFLSSISTGCPVLLIWKRSSCMIYEVAVHPHKKKIWRFQTACICIYTCSPFDAAETVQRKATHNNLLKWRARSVAHTHPFPCRGSTGWLPEGLYSLIRIKGSMKTAVKSAFYGRTWRLHEPGMMSVKAQQHQGSSSFRRLYCTPCLQFGAFSERP